MPECSKASGKRIETCVNIVDLDGVSVLKLFMGKVKKFLKISSGITQDYYPELMHKMFIINSGFFFKGVWSVIKLWLDPVTQKKIVIISGSGKKELLEQVGADNLPEYLGGNFKGDLQ